MITSGGRLSRTLNISSIRVNRLNVYESNIEKMKRGEHIVIKKRRTCTIQLFTVCTKEIANHFN